MKLKLSRRDLILIAAFWLVGCALMTIVVYFAVFQPVAQPLSPGGGGPQATFTLVAGDQTARNLQTAAREQVARWQADAQLFTVAATWEQTDLNRLTEPATWTYRFYSPALRRFYFVTVRPDGEVTGISHSERVRTPPPVINPDVWQIDSPQALNIWLNQGGATLLQAIPGIQIVAQLQVNSPDDPLTWAVAGYDKISKNYHTVFINAQTGEVINIETSLN